MITKEVWKKYINAKFVEWRDDSRNTLTDFARWLEVPRDVVSKWMNDGTPPSMLYLSNLVAKYPEIYEVLGLPGKVVSAPEWLSLLPPDLRDPFERAAVEANSRIADAGISVDSPEGRSILIKTFSEFGITIKDIE